MDNNFSEAVEKERVTVAEQVPEPIPVEVEETTSVKIRKRRTRSEIDAGLSLDEINSVKQQDSQLQESVNKVVGQMKQHLGLPEDINSLISQQQIDAWRLQYGELYRTYLNNQSFIWHKIRRKDYIALMTDEEMSNVENGELRIFLRQEKIIKLCVLYPDNVTLENLVENNAGIAGNIADEIMMASGFRPVSTEQI